MAERILQRVIMPPRRKLTRLYCRFKGASSQSRKQGRRSIFLTGDTVLRTDTWFNAFFESYWRQYTHVSELALRLCVSGTGTLRLYRRSSEKKRLLHEIEFTGQERELHILLEEFPDSGSESGGRGSCRASTLGSAGASPSRYTAPATALADAPASSSQSNLLFFELEAHSSRLMMHGAQWVAREVAAAPVRLVAGICTFNRVQMLVPNILDLFADSDVAEVLDRIIVVDQGSERVRNHPAFAALMRAADGRLQLVEQDNRGGAGGFTRCLLEAQRTDSATHVLLMDDDIIPESESVLRAAAFLSLARGDLAVGGHMLDRFRPCQIVESGSRYLPERVRIDEPRRSRVDRARDLMPFLKLRPRHYNGWWFFTFPLKVLERTGLPLPLFLRGDDLEFGCRLMRQGVPTVALPGVAVWHEPFERKGRGWHAFYELRNLLIVGALHFPIVRATTVARQFFSRLLDELLTYDYYEAWLLCEAVAAYLHGPKALRHPPDAIQQRLQAMSEKLASQIQLDGEEQRAGSVSDGPASVAHAPGSSLRIRRWWLVLRNLLWPSPFTEAQPQRLLRGNGEQWYDISSADVVGVSEPHHDRIVVLRRSRGRFVRLLFRGLWLALRLLGGHRRAVHRWRKSVLSLTSPTFWMKYLHRPVSPVCQPAAPAEDGLADAA